MSTERDFEAEVEAFDDTEALPDGSEWRIRAAGLDHLVIELALPIGGTQTITITDSQAEALLAVLMRAVG